MERGLAVDRMAVEIHSELNSAMAVVASAELFATVAEIVAVVDAVVDARLVGETTDETVGEVAGVGGVGADGVLDAAVDEEGAM